MAAYLRLLLLLVLMPWPALALDPDDSIENYARRSWFTDDGLPHNTVHDLVQDSRGYVWLSTWDGIARFNGRDFLVHSRRTQPGLDEDGVRALALDHDGVLYAASARGGVFLLRDGEWSAVAAGEGVSARGTALEFDAKGSLWVGSQDQGLARLVDGRLEAFAHNAALAHPWILALLSDREHRLWIATARGLHRYDGQTLESFGPSEGIPAANIFALEQDAAGALWVGTSEGLYRSDRGRFERVPIPGHDGAVVSAILEDRDGNLWLGTQSGGLLRLRGGTVEVLNASQGLSNNRILRLYEDREGGLWIATNAGLNRLRDSVFQTYSRREGLADDFVRSIHQGGSGAIWVGTSEGLSRFAQGRMAVDPRVPRGASVMTVLEDSSGRLWVGTYDRGLLEIGPHGSERWWGREDGFEFEQVRALHEASDGAIWVGTAGGAFRLRDGRIEASYGLADGLADAYVLSLYETRDGRIWIGTVNGFAIFSAEGVETWQGENGFPAENVFDFHQDALGTVWIASDSGLIQHRDGQFRVFGEKEGLPDTRLFRILDDQRGRFWLTSNAGLMQVSQDELEDIAAGSRERLAVGVYGRDDGMASTQCNGGSQPAGWRDRKGLLWLPTARGVTVFDPDGRSEADAVAPPRAIIESLRADGTPLALGADLLGVAAGTRRLELQYAGLSFGEPERLRYRYRLQGFDPDWIEAGAVREATYTNLPPGQYRFEVVAGTGGVRFSEEADGVEFVLQPHFWETRWFAVLVGLTLVLAGSLVPIWRARHLRRRERRLAVLVDERTQELKAKNVELEKANAETSRLMTMLRTQAESFARQAHEDPLTGLPNRRRFRELVRFAEQGARARRDVLTLGLADLDYFKQFNDRYGHDVGDRVLVAVGRVLAEVVGKRGLVARYGGEEFALSFPSLNVAQVRQIAEDILARVRALTIEDLPEPHALSISIGLCALGPEGYDAALRRADELLYRAKHSGRGRVEVDDEAAGAAGG